jgi:hypothetical protein
VGKSVGGREVRLGTTCDCNTRIAYFGQCRHLIVVNEGKFVKSLWAERWLQRVSLRCASSSDKSSNYVSAAAEGFIDGATAAIGFINDATASEGIIDGASAFTNGITAAEGFIDGTTAATAAAQGSVDSDDELGIDLNEAARSFTFCDIMNIGRNIASCIVKRRDIPMQVGMLLQYQDFLMAGSRQACDSNTAPVPFDETFRAHISSFARHTNKGISLFMETQNEQGELEKRTQSLLKKQGTPRDQGGRLPLKRLKSNQEKAVRGIPIKSVQSSLVVAKPRTQKCSFCGLSGHRRGHETCKAFTALKAQFVSHEDDFEMWKMRLGDPMFHLVEAPSATQIKAMKNVDWKAPIPKVVHHVVLLKCYYSKAHLEYKSRKMSQYRDMEGQDLPPPSMEYNVMQVILLCEGAVDYQEHHQPCFMLVSSVKDWISTNCKKTTHKYILSSLKSGTLTNNNNTY